MQWFLDATTTGHKLALMVVAILLLAAGMAAVQVAVPIVPAFPVPDASATVVPVPSLNE